MERQKTREKNETQNEMCIKNRNYCSGIRNRLLQKKGDGKKPKDPLLDNLFKK